MISCSFLGDILTDALFSAIAAIGFAVISNPPRKAILISALLAAVGHGLRYFLMHSSLTAFSITTASLCAAVSIGLLAIPFARSIHCPAEVFTFPSLLPMIPGMYAYKTVLSLTRFLHASHHDEAVGYLVSIFQNGLTTVFVLFALVLGATIPVFIFHRQSFSMTRIDNGALVGRKD